MASYDYPSGPFQSLFVGHFGATGSPLTRIQLTSTGNFEIRESMEMTWVQATGSYEQAGARTITLSLALMSNDPVAINLARGLALNAVPYGTLTNQKYVIFLYDGDTDQNYVIPCCQASPLNLQIVRGKSIQSQTPLQFSYTDPDLDTELWVSGDLDEIEAYLGAMYPL